MRGESAEPTMPDTVSLTVGNLIHEGWTSAEVTRSIETVSGAFSVGLAGRGPGGVNPIAITPGQACTVAIGGQTVITGFLDAVSSSYDKGSHSVTIRGRDATGDLVDCAARAGAGRWSGVGGLPIARDICAPFKIAVSAAADVSRPFQAFHLQTGETAFAALDRLCKAYGVLPMSDGQGGLLLTRAGAGGACAELRLGGNILRASAEFDHKDRFQTYTVLAQSATRDDVPPEASTGGQGQATDPAVTRYRPRLIVADQPDNGADYDLRARWEASSRAGRALRATLTVQGWRDAAGALYRPNTVVDVQDDWLGIHASLVVASVKLSLSAQGTTAELTVAPAAAFDIQPMPKAFEGVGG